MPQELYTKEVDSTSYDNLFAGMSVDIAKKSVTLQAAQGVITRGTVLGIITATGLAVPVDSTKADGSQSADCILADDTDTGAAGAVDNVVAVAYSAGQFNRKALIFGGADTAPTHETRLRELGIFLKDNISY